MIKAEVRKRAIAQRKILSEADMELFNQALLDHFSSLDFTSVKVIHIFLPISEKKEPDTFLLIDWLTIHHPEIKIIVPKADFDTALMRNYVYPGKAGLVKNPYHILEPQAGELHTGPVDVVLVPMLAFDLKGYRAGYGKGFYDRFLSELTTLKVGLSFFEPVEQIEDINVYDVCLDLCITPKKIYQF